jgi:hypothetical protein
MWVDLSYALLFSKLRYFRNHVNCILLQDSLAFGDIASYSVKLDRHLIRWRAHGAGSASLITDENSLMTAKEVRAQPVDATPPVLKGRGLKPKAFPRRGLAAIRRCTSASESDQGTALLAISTDLTSTCYCVAET